MRSASELGNETEECPEISFIAHSPAGYIKNTPVPTTNDNTPFTERVSTLLPFNQMDGILTDKAAV